MGECILARNASGGGGGSPAIFSETGTNYIVYQNNYNGNKTLNMGASPTLLEVSKVFENPVAFVCLVNTETQMQVTNGGFCAIEGYDNVVTLGYYYTGSTYPIEAWIEKRDSATWLRVKSTEANVSVRFHCMLMEKELA